ncbi:enoyl-CoA hydratase/isomerase family protein [Verrucomicrobiaceae bacterium 5K15]|uniref:enoyl-CoA hydratase n=1 Tax=Oceaniferula flava TaxID=2800421 RepID=A0AAE2SDW0_9BACT|nr:3-hydroxyacyl-CoA dehydrogenase NAD-binding domain-containing protein [Oceaniferula flavus]MBK1855949.1 enoyl-CoA hydratase/isomerase family protein [Oceaniferula flavus]MBM1137256.1 enoyl-CoA hydratase/isomerase family protein [Oceaniferula flavus]
MANIKRSTEDHIAILTFDRENSGANIFDRDVLLELDDHIATIEQDSALQGLLINSAKRSIFIAGADIKTLFSAPKDELAQLLELGQRVFDRLAALKITTVAAIHGACAGGGCELALACDWRVLSDASATRIGLPETQLGILPAWGGSTRLPNMIGLPDALGLILAGKLLKAGAAKHKGLADAVCPPEDLKDYAKTFLQRGKRKYDSHSMLHNRLSVSMIRKKAEANVMKKTRGLYPAALKALEVVSGAVNCSHHDSLGNERAAFLELAELPQTKRLIGLFFLNERFKKLKPNDVGPAPVETVATIGAGVMGSGIAYWLSTRGKKVILQDINDEAIAKGLAGIEKLYQGSVKKRVMSKVEAVRGFDLIHASANRVPLQLCDMVIEAASENLEIKKKIFADLSERTSAKTILATNTSALPIHELAPVISHPERLVGLHFFNPVHRMKLVEVVQTESTSPETLATAVAFVQKIGKLPVVVKDRPGFLVNRILLPYLVEAGEMFSRGGDPREIDRAMLDFGMPMGPIRLLDEVGLDVGIHVAKTLAAAFPDRMKVPEILTEMVEQGFLGKKTGQGFYLYQGSGELVPNPEVLAMRTGHEAPEDIAAKLAGMMTDEAILCLDEGVASAPEDIDFAMVMGTGFAPFRGGPLRYSDDNDLHKRKFYQQSPSP